MRKLIAVSCVAGVLAGCSAPLVNDAQPQTKRSFAQQSNKTGGLFSGLFSRSGAPTPIDRESTLEPRANTAVLATKNAIEEPQDVTAEPVEKPAVLSGLFRRKAAKQTDPVEVKLASLEGDALSAATKGAVLAEPVRKRSPRRSESDTVEISLGDSLPFGIVGRVCDVKTSELGQRLEKAGRGRGYAIYDSAPGATHPRAFYVTGFRDGCARQVTAALAMFGAPSMHEALRYGRPSDAYPYSATDKAYEKVKSSVCKVSRRKPCGARISQLEHDTVFVSTYERFSNNGRWADVLLHDGQIMAASIKAP